MRANADRPGLAAAAWILYGGAIWFLLVALPDRIPTPELDPSWAAALNYLKTINAQFGTDAIMTYGPLGYLHNGGFISGGYYSAETWLPFITFQFLQKAFYVWLICWVGCRLQLTERVIFLAWSALLSALGNDAIALLIITYSGVLLCSCRRFSGITLLAMAFIATESLVKGTFLFFSIFVVCCVCLHGILCRRWNIGQLTAPLLLGASIMVLWVWAAKQRLNGLPAFVTNSWSISDAHQGGPVLEQQLDVVVTAAAGFILAAVQFGLLGWRELRSGNSAALAIVFILDGGLFVAWKQGFVRADGLHNQVFYVFLLSALAAAHPLFRPQGGVKRGFDVSRALQTIAPILIILGLSSVTRPFPPIAAELRSKFQWLTAPKDSLAAMDAMAGQTAERFSLPRTRSVVGASTVDVIGLQQAIALVNKLNYHPSPIFQGYVACSTPLAQLNAEFYRSTKAPEFVLLKAQDIDQHFPTLDNAAVINELRRSYHFMFEEGGYLVLQRTHSPPGAELIPFASGKARRGDKISIPPGTVWCQIKIRDNILGRLAKLLYHRSPEWIDVTSETQHRYSLPASMAETPFLISPLLENNEQIAEFFEHRNPQQTVTLIAIEDAPLRRLLTKPDIHYTLYKVPQ
jgi:hypothetical protein